MKTQYTLLSLGVKALSGFLTQNFPFQWQGCCFWYLKLTVFCYVTWTSLLFEGCLCDACKAMFFVCQDNFVKQRRSRPILIYTVLIDQIHSSNPWFISHPWKILNLYNILTCNIQPKFWNLVMSHIEYLKSWFCITMKNVEYSKLA